MDTAKMLLALLLAALTRFAISMIRFRPRRCFACRRCFSTGHANKILELNVTKYEAKEPVEGCIFCLSGVEEGEEIRELRCRHIFHRPCLDRWVEHEGMTCPICREWLVAREEAAEEEEEEEIAEMDGDNELGPVLMAYISYWMGVRVLKRKNSASLAYGSFS